MLTKRKGEARGLQADEMVCLNPQGKRDCVPDRFTTVYVVYDILKVESHIVWNKGKGKDLVVKS